MHVFWQDWLDGSCFHHHPGGCPGDLYEFSGIYAATPPHRGVGVGREPVTIKGASVGTGSGRGSLGSIAGVTVPMCNSTRRSAGAGCRVSGAGGSVEVGGLALGAHTGVYAWHQKRMVAGVAGVGMLHRPIKPQRNASTKLTYSY